VASGFPQLRQALFSNHPYGVWSAHALQLADLLEEDVIAQGVEACLKNVKLSCVAIVPPGYGNGLDGLAAKMADLNHLATARVEARRDNHSSFAQFLPVCQELSETDSIFGISTFGLEDHAWATHTIIAAAMHARSGRLHKVLRDKSALVYSISSLVQQGIRGGTCGTYLRTTNHMQGRILRLAIEEARRLLTEGIDDSELEKCKRIALLSLAETLSSSCALVRRIGLLHHLERFWDIQEERREIETLTVSEMDAALTRLAGGSIATLTRVV
jgi:hypothetical protein